MGAYERQLAWQAQAEADMIEGLRAGLLNAIEDAELDAAVEDMPALMAMATGRAYTRGGFKSAAAAHQYARSLGLKPGQYGVTPRR
jgi:hypothetical protein